MPNRNLLAHYEIFPLCNLILLFNIIQVCLCQLFSSNRSRHSLSHMNSTIMLLRHSRSHMKQHNNAYTSNKFTEKGNIPWPSFSKTFQLHDAFLQRGQKEKIFSLFPPFLVPFYVLLHRFSASCCTFRPCRNHLIRSEIKLVLKIPLMAGAALAVKLLRMMSGRLGNLTSLDSC